MSRASPATRGNHSGNSCTSGRCAPSRTSLTITLGQFLSNDVRLPAGSPTGTIGATVLVQKTEEKGSDVNLATLLLKEGFQGLHYVAVGISNDSDLVLAVQVVRAELAKPVGVLDPHRPEFPFAAERELLHSERCGTRG